MLSGKVRSEKLSEYPSEAKPLGPSTNTDYFTNSRQTFPLNSIVKQRSNHVWWSAIFIHIHRSAVPLVCRIMNKKVSLTTGRQVNEASKTVLTDWFQAKEASVKIKTASRSFIVDSHHQRHRNPWEEMLADPLFGQRFHRRCLCWYHRLCDASSATKKKCEAQIFLSSHIFWTRVNLNWIHFTIRDLSPLSSFILIISNIAVVQKTLQFVLC